MIHTISLNQTRCLTIRADQRYSDEAVAVKHGEGYDISCEKDQHWKDWFIETTPKGFFNPFASLVGLRKKGVKCFCLCGVYDNDDNTAFEIGLTTKNVSPNTQALLSFFPNDAWGAYWNNSGQVKINVTRIR